MANKYWIVSMPEGEHPKSYCEMIFKWGYPEACKECSPRINPCPLANAKEVVEVPVMDGQEFSVRFETNGDKTDWQKTKLFAVKENL